MKIINKTKNSVIAAQCQLADTFFSRFKGLMGRKELSSSTGLLITPCNSIHMFFMRFPLDVIFLDKNNRIVHIIEDIKPWKVSKIVFQAHSTLELPIGTINTSTSTIGDELDIIP